MMSLVELLYRTRAIITRSWFETALDYKPRILGWKDILHLQNQYINI